MRAQKYNDGIKRINAKIEVPLSNEDVGDYILSALIGGLGLSKGTKNAP